MNLDLETRIQNLPGKPGVYLFQNEEGKIIYIGKAKNLKNRVRSYFQQGRITDSKTDAMVAEVCDLPLMPTVQSNRLEFQHPAPPALSSIRALLKGRE